MKKKVIAIGEVLWDCLPDGRRPGGAPANFLCHFSRNDICSEYEPVLVSAVGDDSDGEEIIEYLKVNGITPEIRKCTHPTGRVDVSVSEDGIPEYRIADNSAWDNISRVEMDGIVPEAVYFGSLAQRSPVSRSSVLGFLDSIDNTSCLKIFDANLRGGYGKYYDRKILEESLSRCNLLKINEEELSVLMECGLCGDTDPCRELVSKYGLKYLILTCGQNGSYVYYCNTGTEVSFMPSGKVSVVDTVGAGDSFAGSFAAAVLCGKDIDEAHRAAAEVAEFVCSVSGAVPDYLAEDGFILRKAVPDDLPRIWEIFLQAKAQMKREGKNQWNESYPLPANISSDIEKGYACVMMHDGSIIAYGAMVFDGEPAYSALEGSWSAEGPYVVFHRLAVADEAKRRGVAGRFFRMVEKLAAMRGVHIFRVDTNYDNAYMLRVFEKSGFRYCGEIVYTSCGRNSRRMAFDKLIL